MSMCKSEKPTELGEFCPWLKHLPKSVAALRNVLYNVLKWNNESLVSVERLYPGRFKSRLEGLDWESLKAATEGVFGGRLKNGIEKSHLIDVLFDFFSEMSQSKIEHGQELIIPIVPIWKEEYHENDCSELATVFHDMITFEKWSEVLKTIKVYKDINREVLIHVMSDDILPIHYCMERNAQVPVEVIVALYSVMNSEEKRLVDKNGRTIFMNVWQSDSSCELMKLFLPDIVEEDFRIKDNKGESLVNHLLKSFVGTKFKPRRSNDDYYCMRNEWIYKYLPKIPQDIINTKQMVVSSLVWTCSEKIIDYFIDAWNSSILEEIFDEILEARHHQRVYRCGVNLIPHYSALSSAFEARIPEASMHKLLDAISTEHLYEVHDCRTYLFDAVASFDVAPSVIKRLLKNAPEKWINQRESFMGQNALHVALSSGSTTGEEVKDIVFEAVNEESRAALSIEKETPPMAFLRNCRRPGRENVPYVVRKFLQYNNGMPLACKELSAHETYNPDPLDIYGHGQVHPYGALIPYIADCVILQQALMYLWIIDSWDNPWATDETTLELLPWTNIRYAHGPLTAPDCLPPLPPMPISSNRRVRSELYDPFSTVPARIPE